MTEPLQRPSPPSNSNGSCLGGLDIIQSMIDISADRLEGLRTQCVTSAELTQQEIRSLETKLVKMFTELLVTKERLPERTPIGMPCAGTAELKQWLRVVGEYDIVALSLSPRPRVDPERSSCLPFQASVRPP